MFPNMNQTASGSPGRIPVEVVRSRRKTLALEVQEDRVLLRAPLRCPRATLEAFVEKNRGWLSRRLQAREERRRALAAIPALREEELAALQKRGRTVFAERAAHFAPLVGVDYGRVTIRSQKTRWGSCSAKGDLNFNCLLLLMPPSVLDYVVVHELCHRKQMNHSPRFWAEVERVIPDYKAAQKWLKDNGRSLLNLLPA